MVLSVEMSIVFNKVLIIKGKDEKAIQAELQGGLPDVHMGAAGRWAGKRPADLCPELYDHRLWEEL